MGLRGDGSRYGAVAVAFHWGTAAVASGLLASGLWMTGLSYSSLWYHAAPELHKTAGMCLASAVLARLAWKGFDRRPASTGRRWERVAARSLHLLLYVLLAALFGSGYLIATADGRPVQVFGIIDIPALARAKGHEALAGKVHLLAAWSLAAAVTLHAAAALKHHFVDRDGVLVRMLGMSRPLKG